VASNLEGQPMDLTLRFQKDGTFRIAVFEDLHFGEGCLVFYVMVYLVLTFVTAEDTTWGPTQDANSTRVLNTILSTENPQLVVLNGDLITGEDTYLENSTTYLDQIVATLIKYDILWASTYGNHDSDFNLSRTDLFREEQRFPGSLTQSVNLPPDAGITNYYLPVYPSNGSMAAPALMLWFFDSRGGNEFQQTDAISGEKIGIPSVVDNSVISWFRETSVRIAANYNRTIPSLAFFHIPTSSMLTFQDGGVDPAKEPGINDDVPLDAQKNDSSFESALLETPGLIATFSGHDHGNDWCFKWSGESTERRHTKRGLFHCFGRHTGYGGYGSWVRGSRQILLREKTLSEEVVTWVRLEDTSISGNVVLNATYGEDEYPVVSR